MMMSVRVTTAVASAAGAVIWPAAMCATTEAMRSPVERLLLSSWCGAQPQTAEFLGHCAVCWGGSAAFLAAALVVLGASRRRARHAAT